MCAPFCSCVAPTRFLRCSSEVWPTRSGLLRWNQLQEHRVCFSCAQVKLRWISLPGRGSPLIQYLHGAQQKQSAHPRVCLQNGSEDNSTGRGRGSALVITQKIISVNLLTESPVSRSGEAAQGSEEEEVEEGEMQRIHVSPGYSLLC